MTRSFPSISARLPPTPGRSASACLLVNLGTPDTADASGVRVYLQGIPVRSPGDRESGPVVEAGAQRHHPAHPPAPQGARLPQDLEHREERIAAQDHHPRASRKARRRASPTTIMSWSTGRCATAIRRSRSRIEALMAQGCDRLLVVPLYPQYSAATSATVCDEVFRVLGEMRAQPTLRVTPPYYDDPDLYRGAGGLDRRASASAAVPARTDRRLVPRHAAEICRQGRSLSGALRRDDRKLAQAHGPRRHRSCC